MSPQYFQDLCRTTAREMGTPLVVPKLFEPWGEPSFYGDWWHHPQKMVLASNGDLIMANIYKGILWRIRPDGSLPPEGWTSAYHAGRNEPFESTTWTQDLWMVPDLKNYLPFHALHYPYFCFDQDGMLDVSAGQSNRPTRQYAYHFEVSHQEVSHQRELSGEEGRGTYVWKCQPQPGPTVHEQAALGGFADPSGLVHDGQHLIVADSGHNRLRVFEADGRLAATITHYEHDGRQHPLQGPTALAMDREHCLYVLVASRAKAADRPLVERTLPLIQQEYLREARTPTEDFTRLIKLKSWREPRLLAASEPLHQDVLQIAVDSGVSPPLVWVANGAGLGSLLQLAGDDLAMGGQWGTDVAPLRCPRQSGGQPILNIDPETGHLYVEDDSNYRLKQYGTVYRIDQAGTVLKKWPPVFFNNLGLKATSPWWTLDYARHFRRPDEPLFIDSIFGKDGRVYRWKLGKGGVEILRFDREGKPVSFAATGTNTLFVDHPMQVGFWHDVYHGMEVDRHGNIYYVAKADVDAPARPVSAYDAVRRQVNVYDARGEVKTRGLLRLDAVRGIQVDDEILALIVDRAFLEGRAPIRDPAAFLDCLAAGRGRLATVTTETLALVAEILQCYHAVRAWLGGPITGAALPSAQDARAHLDRLVYRGFLLHVPWDRLLSYPRYLGAIARRLERLGHAALRDRDRLAEVAGIEGEWLAREAQAREAARIDPRLDEIRWLLEELRVSLFAQELKTAVQVSVKRIERRWRELGL